jgi:RHS repeat-associated protein
MVVSGQGTAHLPWTYYLLGPNNEQLAVWNGFAGAACGTTANTVRLWPVEYNVYSGGERTIIRPNGTRELVMSNHLGSTACIFPLTGVNRTPIAQQVTDAYGIPLTLQGAADPQRSRTSFIGRDVDKESNLGAFGARLYSSEYGRFVAVDKLWEGYGHMSVYQYCRNSPGMSVDPSGLGDEPAQSKPVLAGLQNGNPTGVIAPATPVTIQNNAIVYTPSAYNCHSYAWSDTHGDPNDPNNATIQYELPRWDNSPVNNMAQAEQLDFFEPNQVGDRLVYFAENPATGAIVATHSAIVEAVDADGNATLVSSKWGQGPLVMHHPRDVPLEYSQDAPEAQDSKGNTYQTRVYFRAANCSTSSNIVPVIFSNP